MNDKFYNLIRKSIEKNKDKVNKRIKEFEIIGRDSEKMFNELCFCILTANYSAKKAIKIQESIGNGFSKLSLDELRFKLKELGYRYPNIRALFIVEARKKKNVLENLSLDDHKDRIAILKEFKGLGWKESSHFLRNIGRKNLAIIDFHIIDILKDNNIIDQKFKRKVISKKDYLEIEEKLREIASDFNISLAELDLYLWAIETGEVLK